VINAKNTAAQKWVSAVNNLGDFGRWEFHICREPKKLVEQL
jgi:type III restriction enzyme